MAAINKNGPSKPPIPNIPPIPIINGANTNKPTSPTNNNNTIHITPTTETTRTTVNTSKPTITTGFVQNNNNNKSTQNRIMPPPPPPGLIKMPYLAKVITATTPKPTGTTQMVNKPMIIANIPKFDISVQNNNNTSITAPNHILNVGISTPSNPDTISNIVQQQHLNNINNIEPTDHQKRPPPPPNICNNDYL